MRDRIEVMEEIGCGPVDWAPRAAADQGRGPGQTASQTAPVAVRLAIRPLADRIGDFVKDAAVPVASVFVRAKSNRSRDRDRAGRLRQREFFAVDGLDDLIAGALSRSPGAIARRPRPAPLAAACCRPNPEHARCLPVLLDFELDLAAAAARLPLHEHVVIPGGGRSGRVQPVGDRDVGCPWPEIRGIWDDDGALRHKAVSGVALAGNPERDRAADRTVVPLPLLSKAVVPVRSSRCHRPTTEEAAAAAACCRRSRRARGRRPRSSRRRPRRTGGGQ